MKFWTSDAKAIGPAGVANGTAAIRASLEQSLSMGIRDLRHEERETYGRGETVVEVTRSVALDRSGQPLITVRYMTLWQKSGGQWRIHRDFVVPISSARQP
jgi:ketosteroid isomerase-like protein